MPTDVIAGMGASLVALLLLSAVGWARLRRGRIRDRAGRLARQLEIDLEGLALRCERVRRRAQLVEEVFARSRPSRSGPLERGPDLLAEAIERLRRDLAAMSDGFPDLGRSALRDQLLRIETLGREVAEMRDALDLADAFWDRALDRVSGARRDPRRPGDGGLARAAV